MKNQKFGKLSFGEKFGYSLGDAAANLAWRPLMAFLPIFYTDTFGLPLATVGLLLAVTRSFDGITDVLMGTICDRTQTRWGKFRPYLLWTAIPFGVLLALTFTTPNTGPTGKVMWAYCTYVLLTLAYTANNVPYSSLSGVMSGSVLERTSISSFRFFGAYLGGLISIGFLPYLVSFIGTKMAPEGSTKEALDAIGYQYSFYILALLLVVFSLIAFGTTKERITPPKKQKANFKAEFKELVSNKPWVIILIVGFLWVTYNSIRQGAAAYYFKWYLDRELLVGLFFIMVILASMISTFVAPVLTKMFGKKRLFIGVMVISGLFTSFIYFVPPTNVSLFFTLGVLAELFAGIMPILFFAMLGDTADYSEYKNKRRATGLTFSAGTFAMKFGGGMAGIAMMFVLSQFNYKLDPNQTAERIGTEIKKVIKTEADTLMDKSTIVSVDTLPIIAEEVNLVVKPATKTTKDYTRIVRVVEEFEISGREVIHTEEYRQPIKALLGIRLINSFVPVIFIVLAILVILLYPLTSDKMNEIETELKARKAKEEA